MAFRVNSVNDYDNQLVPLVMTGTLHVVSSIDYNKLPVRLKSRYYPLFRRADTTYRLYPQYMRQRRDVDPNTKISTIVTPRNIIVQRQVEKDPVMVVSQKPLPINATVARPQTDLSKKTRSEIVQEQAYLVRNRAGVTTRYSRY